MQKNIKNDLLEQRIKTAFRGFTFNYTNNDEKQFDIDGKRWKVLNPAGTATLWQRCHNVVIDVVTALWYYRKWALSDVVKTLPQRRHNIKQMVSKPFYYRQFRFLSCHRNVRELQKHLSIESSLRQTRRILVNSWLSLLLVSE